jgi:Lrp/AsnC family transcriptional regulator of ectoine degradation
MLKLDDRDVKILSILAREGRISKAELARRVNLSAAPAWERMKRLEEAGIITGYHASVALKKLGPHLVVFLAAELESHRAQDFQAFERAIAPLDEVVACWAVGGGFDYMLEAKAGLSRYFTYVVTKPVKQGPLPLEQLLALPAKE